MIPQLLVLLLLANQAPATGVATMPDTRPTVVALTSGQRLLVQSYRLEGRMLRIVGTDGQALILKAELFDAERSEKMTAAYRDRLRRERVENREAAARAERERLDRAQRNAAHRAQSSGAGGLWIAPAIDDAIISQPIEKTLEDWSADGLDEAGRKAVRRHNQTVREHNDLVAGLTEPDADREELSVEITRLRESIAAMRGRIRDARRTASEADGEQIAAKN